MCKDKKDKSEFYNNRAKKDGKTDECKKCVVIRDEGYYEKNRAIKRNNEFDKIDFENWLDNKNDSNDI